jgi:hypothetical protein
MKNKGKVNKFIYRINKLINKLNKFNLIILENCCHNQSNSYGRN